MPDKDALLQGVAQFAKRLTRGWHYRSPKQMSETPQRVVNSSREARLTALLTVTPAVTIDARSRILAVSPSACALFRMAEDEVEGRSLSDLVEGFNLATISKATHQSGQISYWKARRSDGERFPVSLQTAEVVGGSSCSEVVVALNDLSLWRAADLQNQKLSEDLHQAWRQNSVGQMAATLSHELNQPLAAAATYLQATQADLSRAGVLGDSAGRTLELAKGQVLRAGAIIRRTRKLLAAEDAPLQPELILPMIQDLEPMIGLLGPEAGTTIHIDVEAGLVMADRIQLQQALANLVRNAVEAVANDDQRQVRLVGRAISFTYYELRVEDSGPGLSDEKARRILEPQSSSKPNGMGLGLSITRRIVEVHGGSLSLGKSALGGAAFAFCLRRAPETQRP